MLRVTYFILAVLIGLGLATLGLWPWAIKPRLYAWMSEQLQIAGADHGLLLRAGEFNVTGFSEIELQSARIDDIHKKWSLQAPLVKLQISPLSLLVGGQPLRQLSLIDPVFIGNVSSSDSSGFHFELPRGLREVTIENGFIQVEDPAHHVAVRIANLNAKMLKRFAQYQLTFDAPDTWADIQGRSINLNTFSFVGSFETGRDSNTLDIRSLELLHKDSTVTTQGRLDFDKFFALKDTSSLTFQAQADLHDVLQPHILDTVLKGTLFAQGECGFKKNTKSLWATGRMGGRDISIDDISITLIDSAFNFENDIIALSQIEAFFAGTLVTADAQIEPHNGWNVGIAANFQNLSLYDFLIDLGIKPVFVDMALDARLQAQGSLWPQFHLNGHMEGSGRDLVVADKTARNLLDKDIFLRSNGPLTVASKIDIDAKAFRFQNMAVSDGISTVSAECELNFQKSNGLQITLVSEHFDFLSIGEKLGKESYRGSGQITGSLNGAYNDIKITGLSSINNFAFEGFNFGTVTSAFLYRGNDLTFSDAQAQSRDINLRGNMTLSFEDDVVIDLHLDQFEASLPEALDYFGETRFQVKGVAAGKLDLKGPVKADKRHHLQGSLALHFETGVTVNDAVFDSFDLAAHTTHDAWVIDSVVAGQGDGSAKASGSITKTTLDTAFKVDVSKIALSEFTKLEGTLSGELSLFGRLNAPSLKGTLSLNDVATDLFQLGNQQISFDSTQSGNLAITGKLLSDSADMNGEIGIDWENRSARLHEFFVKTKKGGVIRLDGVWAENDATLNIAAELGLDTLTLAHEDFESIQGKLTARVQLKGNVLDPIWSGSIDIVDGGVRYSQLANPIEEVNAHFKLSNKEVLMTSAKGKCGSGILEANGRSVLNGYTPNEIESRIVFRALPFEMSSLISGVASGFVDFRKLDNDISLSGDVRIKDSFVTALRPDDFKFPARSVHASNTPIRLDIKVKSDEPIRVDTDLLSGDLDANVQIVGNHLNLGLVGSLELKSGGVNFRNQSYQLLKARVDFDDTYKIVPRLDVLANGRIDNYAIQIRLQGTPDRPQFHLTSDPYLPESQLLVLMSLGYAAQDIKAFATTARTTGLEALSLYLGLGNNVVRFLNRRESSDFLKLEELSLSSLFSKSMGVSLPAVRVGMNVWSGVKLRLHSTLVDNENGKREQRVEFEQNLGSQMKWRLGWDSDGLSNYGDAGFDLWYRWELE
jgi:hypothetical protein